MSTGSLPHLHSLQASDPDPYSQHDRWTPQQLQGYQARALRACREYAYIHSPFYQHFHRGLMDRPLQELPVLTKAVLMEHFDDLVTHRAIRLQDVQQFLALQGGQARFLDRYWVMAASGSTGQPGVFLAGPAEGATLTVGFARFPTWAGMTPETRFALIASTASQHMSSQIPAMVNGQLLPRLQLSASDPVETLVRQFNKWQPEAVAGYPSILRVLAEEQRQGRLQIAPRFIFSASETLMDETRRLKFLNFPEKSVRQVAITYLGHIARIHRVIDSDRVIPILEALLSDPDLTGVAEDALDDIKQFIKGE